MIGGQLEGLLTEKQANHGIWNEFQKTFTVFKKVKNRRSSFMTFVPPVIVNAPLYAPRVTIAMLPDVALLVIFDFYVHEWPEKWYKLVHVCREWRNVVFGSPGRLNLRLYCTARTPVMKTLDVWPPLPIVIHVANYRLHFQGDLNNIVAALEHNDRICQLTLISISLEKVMATMQQPFPALTYLELAPSRDSETAPVDANSFLGGSAPPHLQTLNLTRIPFPGLPKLLLSATYLVHLILWDIPHSGYFKPEAMVTGLSVLTRLTHLEIGFKSPRSRPDRRRPPPPTRTLLPVLTELQFKGVSEYLEDLVAQIDAPLLDKLEITFFYQLLFDTPHLSQFISRTPKFKAYHEARVAFPDFVVSVTTFNGRLNLTILCSQSDWQLSSLAQVCSSCFPQSLISTVEDLYIWNQFYRPEPTDFPFDSVEDFHGQDDIGQDDIGQDDIGQDNIENIQWLEFLHPFTATKHLYISTASMPIIAPALLEFDGESVTGVLPTLETIFLEERPWRKPLQEAIEKFVVSRQLSGHPITISRWLDD